jgi:hypothetical protein
VKTLGYKKLINVLQAFNDVVKVVMQGTTAAGLLPVGANLENMKQGASKRQRLAAAGSYAPGGAIITESWEDQYARSMGFASVADAMKYAQANSAQANSAQSTAVAQAHMAAHQAAQAAHGVAGGAQAAATAQAHDWSEYNAWAAQAQAHAALDPAAAAAYAHGYANMQQGAAGHAAWAAMPGAAMTGVAQAGTAYAYAAQ